MSFNWTADAEAKLIAIFVCHRKCKVLDLEKNLKDEFLDSYPNYTASGATLRVKASKLHGEPSKYISS